MRIFRKILIFLLITTPLYAASGSNTAPLICQEADGTPRSVCTTIKFPNGTLSQSGTITTYTASTVSPGGNSGAVQYNNSSALGGDDTNFFWDATNKRLGVGTNAPLYQVHGVKVAHNYWQIEATTNGVAGLRLYNSNTGQLSVIESTGNQFRFENDSGSEVSRFRILYTGGTATNPIYTFSAIDQGSELFQILKNGTIVINTLVNSTSQFMTTDGSGNVSLANAVSPEVHSATCNTASCTATATCSGNKIVAFGMSSTTSTSCNTNPAQCSAFCTIGSTSCAATSGASAASVYVSCTNP